MTAYERDIVKRIYPIACTGNKKAIKILQNLTTKKRKGVKCPMCGNRMTRIRTDKTVPKHCSVKCYQYSRHRAKITNHQ